MNDQSSDISPEELTELYTLPDDALVTAAEAAAFLRLKVNTLAWYRCKGCGPSFVRIGGTSIRYRLGDIRAYAKGHGQSEDQSQMAELRLYVRRACQ
ncbi:helix-turn-helix transcriptional regulator [Stutzerimonas nitrititolerans]|uniref:helix-turn-helix transcriptional regulator n=1 Tax=Stutzerimonas nitrititolerans TaxID=2482751 RepID=UPI0028A6C038|nr:helix-turn-helix domain-containing protein [Stutzerimonas nitrititolerans]